MKEKLKSLLQIDQVFYSLLILLVGICSFGLGRASSASMTNDSPVVSITRVPEREVAIPISSNETKVSPTLVVASKSGTKYHRPDCPGALQINPENLIEFASALEARAAGYTPAANCAGLK